MSGRRAVRYSTLQQQTPEQAGDEAARKKIAEADALQRETATRRAAATPSPVFASLNRPPATNREVKLGGGTPLAPGGLHGSALDEPAYAHSRYAYGSQGSAGVPNETAEAGRHRMDVQREHEFGSFFHPDQSGPASKPVSPAPSGPFGALPDSGLTITPTGVTQRNADGGVTVDSQYGGGTSRIVKPNELVQPYFATEKGNDLTHTVLPKTPGEDPNLDPIYAANVFRKAGDEKTALAYEKHAGTLNPAQYTGPNGAAWQNPFFGQKPAAPASAPAAPAAPAVVRGPLDLATPPSTQFNVPPSLANIPAEETFAGKPLSAITDVTSGAPAFPTPAYQAGQAARKVVGDVASGIGASLSGAIPPNALSLAKGGVTTPPAAPGPGILASVGEFARGASTAAGASRATAADFQQPTQASPLPKTPTTPLDRGAIASFGGLGTPAAAPTSTPPPKPVDDRYVFKGF